MCDRPPLRSICFRSRGDFVWKLRHLLIAVPGVLAIAGCIDTEDTGGRVEIQVSVTVDGEKSGDGTLALRPQPGVQSPLIRISVVNGSGAAPQNEGPVPGKYLAQFRGLDGKADLSSYLSRTGRIDPYAKDEATPANVRSEIPDSTRILNTVEVVVPNKNPANVEMQFSTQ